MFRPTRVLFPDCSSLFTAWSLPVFLYGSAADLIPDLALCATLSLRHQLLSDLPVLGWAARWLYPPNGSVMRVTCALVFSPHKSYISLYCYGGRAVVSAGRQRLAATVVQCLYTSWSATWHLYIQGVRGESPEFHRPPMLPPPPPPVMRG